MSRLNGLMATRPAHPDPRETIAKKLTLTEMLEAAREFIASAPEHLRETRRRYAMARSPEVAEQLA